MTQHTTQGHSPGADRAGVHQQLQLALETTEYQGPGRRTLDRLRVVHPRPLVRYPTTMGEMVSRRVSPHQMGLYPQVQIGHAGSSIAALILDVDHESRSGSEARDRIRDVGLVDPSWIVRRRRSGHVHAAWGLERPVHRYPEARRAPVHMLARIADYYSSTMRADPAYSGSLSHNPECLGDWGADHDVEVMWGPRGCYLLDALAAPIPKGWRRPRQLPLTAIGRNVATFGAAMVWAGRPAHAQRPVEAWVRMWDAEHHDPRLPDSEIRSIAKSVERYRSGWVMEWHTSAWIARQAARGRRGGRRSGTRRRAATADRDARIVELRASGLSIRQIGREVGLRSSSSVHDALRRQGVR